MNSVGPSTWLPQALSHLKASLDTMVQLFGKIARVFAPQIESGSFHFSLATIELHGRNWIPLSAIAKHHQEHSPLAEKHNAPWVRGRLQTVFNFNHKADNLECESRIDDRVFADRIMLNASFVAEKTELDTTIQMPFICTEQFAEAAICLGSLPERNTNRNQQMISSVVHSFVDLLLATDHLNDYDDHAVTFGERYQFGVRDGVPYNGFLESRH